MTLEEKLTLDEFIIFVKTKTKNTAQNPSIFFIDKVTEIYERKKKDEFKNPLSREFTSYSNKIEYWLERGWEENEAETKRQEKVEASSCSLSALIKKHGETRGKELFDEINNKKSNTLEGFIQRHGKVKGKKLYESYKKQMSEQNTLDGMIKRYGKEIGTEKYNSMIDGKVQTLDNHIKRYGKKEGTKRYLESNKKRGRSQTFEGFVEKYGDEAESKWEEFVKERSHRTSLNYYIEKYGQVKGKLKYQEWFETTIGGDNSLSQSKVSRTLFEKLDGSIKSSFGENEIIIELTEMEQKELGKKFIRPDFLINNKIIEFYGTYWHCHPSMFEADQINYQVGKSAKEVWEYDSKRVDILRNKGFNVLVVWEKDYSENKDLIIEECNNFLMSDNFSASGN